MNIFHLPIGWLATSFLFERHLIGGGEGKETAREVFLATCQEKLGGGVLFFSIRLLLKGAGAVGTEWKLASRFSPATAHTEVSTIVGVHFASQYFL